MLFIRFNLFLFFLVSVLDAQSSFIQKLVSDHPEIQVYQKSTLSKFADSNHSSVYPDPKIGISFRNYPYYGNPTKLVSGRPDTPGMTGVEYMISQEIPYPGKLGGERDLRRLGAKEYAVSAVIQTNRFLGDFLSTIVQLDFVEKKMKHLESITKISDSIRKVSNAEYIVGKKSLGLTSDNHIGSVESKERIVDLNSTKESLLAFLDYYQIEGKISKSEILDFRYEEDLKKIETLLGNFTKSSEYGIPGVIQKKIDLEKNIQDQKLKEITHYPDAEIFFAYMKRRNTFYTIDTGPIATVMGNWQVMDKTEFQGDLFSFGATIRVPVWSLGKNKELQKSSEWNTQAKRSELEQVQKYFQSEIPRRMAIVKGLSQRIQIMEKEHLPLLNKSISSSGANYEAGKMFYTDLAKTQLELINLKLNIDELKEKRFLTILSVAELVGLFTNMYDVDFSKTQNGDSHETK